MDFDPFASLGSDNDSQFMSSNQTATENTVEKDATERVDPFSWSEPSLGEEMVIGDADNSKIDSVNESLDFDKKSDNLELPATSDLSQPLELPGSVPFLAETETDIPQTPAGTETSPQVKTRKVNGFLSI